MTAKRGTPEWHIAQVRAWRDAGYPANRVPLNSVDFLLTQAERTHGK
jgi:hypothetical protein